MDADDRLRLDYEQTTELMRTLSDIRFKLLAFVPTIAGATVGLVGRSEPSSVLLAVGLLGLSATLGILLYELRNAQIFDSLVERAAMLEQKLGLGLFNERPRDNVTLFGMVAARHERGLGLVYGAALAGWTYLTVWGALRALDVGGAQKIGALVGVAAWALVVVDVERIGARGERTPAPQSR
jgi:hypothetical protein